MTQQVTDRFWQAEARTEETKQFIRDIKCIATVWDILASKYGGGGGIRTHGPLAGTTVFKTVSLDHSDTPP